MDMRAEVWSPLQNASVWLAAWMHGLEATDDLIDAWSDLGFSTPVDLLADLRRGKIEGEPAVRLVLSGPGEASGLPGGRREGIVIQESQVLVPNWEVLELTQPLPSPMVHSPGEADELLTRATNEAARLVTASGYRTDALNNPRLTVGTLADFYDMPGLPGSTPPRAAKLFARADRVAAIIETVTERVGDHSLDTHLLKLWRHIRAARMVGVEYSAREFMR